MSREPAERIAELRRAEETRYAVALATAGICTVFGAFLAFLIYRKQGICAELACFLAIASAPPAVYCTIAGQIRKSIRRLEGKERDAAAKPGRRVDRIRGGATMTPWENTEGT